ncbi:hypothetical protein ABPG75_010075 [Micractinium tetrahymenae]
MLKAKRRPAAATLLCRRALEVLKAWGAASARRTAPPPEASSLQDGPPPPGFVAADLSDCGPPPTDGTAPPGSHATWQLQVNGTRNYTCVGGKPLYDGVMFTYSGGDTGTVQYTLPMPGEENGRFGYGVITLKQHGQYYYDTLQNYTYAPEGKTVRLRFPIVWLSMGATDCDYIISSNPTGGKLGALGVPDARLAGDPM